ncbi:MAG: hypothetical protein NT080_02055 [Spirochaetes bacterium]|nr:hypothetical protein [Spirochaetota bacterium]
MPGEKKSQSIPDDRDIPMQQPKEMPWEVNGLFLLDSPGTEFEIDVVPVHASDSSGLLPFNLP